MRKIVFYISLILFVACNDDSQSDSAKIDQSLLVGEWVSPNSLHSQFVDLELSNSSWAQYSIITNEVGSNSINEKEEGIWSWHDNNNGLSVTTTKHSLPECLVMTLTDDSLIMRNLSFNSIEKFYRVVETIELYAGNSTQIKYLIEHSDFSAQQITSFNEEIVTVSNDGVIEAKQGGVTFIRLKDDQRNLFVKVTVIGRIDRFAGLVLLPMSDVVNQFGEPDVSSTVELYIDGKKNYGLLVYNNPTFDSKLIKVECYFDLINDEIYRVKSFYNSTEPFISDCSIIDKYWHYFEMDNVAYSWGKEEAFYDNECILDIYDNSISFTNRNFSDIVN